MNDKKAEFQTKLNRFNTAVNGGTPDTVPVMTMVDTYVLAQAHYSIQDAWVKDVTKCIDAHRRFNEVVYADATFDTGNSIPFEMLELFGSSLYTITGETVQIKGSAGATMKDDEYPALIADPEAFFMDTILPRKYEVLRSTDVDFPLLFKDAVIRLGKWASFDKKAKKGIEKAGLPVAARGYHFLAPDFMLDFLRDFVGISKDIRRRPEELFAACEAVFPLMLEMTKMTAKPDPDHVVWIPLHLPTYMHPKDFEKLYLPFMIRSIQELNTMGYRQMFFCERDWTAYASYLQDLPAGQNCYIFESGDLKLLRENIRGKGCFIGGMHSDLLKFGTKEQCIDDAKRCLDEYAAGGGYIFCTDKGLLCGDDAKIENLAAVNEYVHVHGKY